MQATEKLQLIQSKGPATDLFLDWRRLLHREKSIEHRLKMIREGSLRNEPELRERVLKHLVEKAAIATRQAKEMRTRMIEHPLRLMQAPTATRPNHIARRQNFHIAPPFQSGMATFDAVAEYDIEKRLENDGSADVVFRPSLDYVDVASYFDADQVRIAGTAVTESLTIFDSGWWTGDDPVNYCYRGMLFRFRLPKLQFDSRIDWMNWGMVDLLHGVAVHSDVADAWMSGVFQTQTDVSAGFPADIERLQSFLYMEIDEDTASPSDRKTSYGHSYGTFVAPAGSEPCVFLGFVAGVASGPGNVSIGVRSNAGLDGIYAHTEPRSTSSPWWDETPPTWLLPVHRHPRPPFCVEYRITPA